MKNIFKSLNKTVLGGAILISVFSVLSKILGLLRDRILASNFGAGHILDSYFAAFRIPDFIFNSLILGALASAFVPVFVKLSKEDEKHAIKVSNSVLNIITLILSVLCLIAFFNIDFLVKLLAPGFNYFQLQLTARLSSIMLISVVIFGFSSVMSSILNSKKTYITYSIAPVFYNLGLIVGIIASKYFGYDMLAWGVVLGALLHFLIQLIEVIKLGWKYEFLFNFKDKNVLRIFKLMIPRTFGLVVNQINQIVITMIASSLIAGSISIFYFALNLQSFVVSIFGVSIAVAIFPVLSEFVGSANHKDLKIYLEKNLRKITFFVLPLSVFMILTRFEIVKIILGAGNFNLQNVNYTAGVLGVFSVSLIFQCVSAIIARVFYAYENTKTPVIIAIISLIANIILCFILSKMMGIKGIALGFSISNILNCLLLLINLSVKYKVFHIKNFSSYFIKIFFNCIIIFVLMCVARLIYIKFIGIESFIEVLAEFIILFTISLALYYFISIFEKLEEVQLIKKYFKKIVNRQ
ncbi:MAG: murein biosynthesis integral membrane protein MurJ [Patescibacteria group bacterium]|nr:murein biosynthesis integral membrane protein MurJ [Patescibacteria group bacterium]